MAQDDSELLPSLVVVDSRNIFHQTEEAIGFRRLPSVEGVIDAMRDYGFDAQQVHIGLALPRSHDAQKLSDAAKVNMAFKTQVESNPRGAVLLGELHKRERARGGFTVEEKQVDVACAVDICRHAIQIARHESKFKAIVVLSQDTDLTPAFKFTRELGVPLVIASHARVEYRKFPYILLTERSFRKMTRTTPKLAGHALRAAVARAASDQGDVWSEFVVQEWDPSRERYIVERDDGLRGVVRDEQIGTAGVGDALKLRVAGVDFGRRRNGFPLATCTARGPHPGHNHRDGFEVARVKRRRSANEIELQAPVWGKSRLAYPPGGLVSGSEVLVDVTEPARPLVVGPRQLPTDRGLVQAAPVCVYPIKELSSTATLAAAPALGRRVVIARSAATRMERGRRYAAVLVESAPNAVAKLVSGPLP